MPTISVTRLRVRSWWYFPSFVVQANRSAQQAAASPGNLAVRLLRDRKNTFWTLTAWLDDAAMKTFMTAGTHGAVMRKLLDWCDEAALAHWTQDSAVLPTWDAAHKRLLQEGRRSKVNHPSAAHTAFEMPAPTTGITRDRKLK
jgi:hypothetical protein